ncbi:MAG TPA: LysE/ArgO family amino acid transporter [Bauldia sp.]|nr:LysE/ArgO family amino acid transporter [Bauldia sp.]
MAEGSLLAIAIQGALLSIGIICAIGPQNAFVLRQGLQKRHVFAVATVCALSDIVLIAGGVAGLGAIVQARPVLLTAIAIVGALFLFAYGALALRRAFHNESLKPANADGGGLGAAVGTCLALTFLNPHVYLDTVVLIGGLSARHPGNGAVAFGVGAAFSSTAWFYSLAYGARLLAPLFARPTAWRVLDLVVTALMWGIALSLAIEAIRGG